MGVVDFAEYVKNAIQAGQAIEGNVVKIIADNGDEIGDAVFKVVQGGNGSASEIGVAVKTGATGATTTGLAYLALDVGVVGAAIAPALGVVAGVGLYNLAPEFWTNVSNALVDAGQTVGGKVIGYWNGDNVHLSQETIEIFKNALVNEGMFNGEIGETETVSGDVIEPVQPFIPQTECTVTFKRTDGVTYTNKFITNVPAIFYMPPTVGAGRPTLTIHMAVDQSDLPKTVTVTRINNSGTSSVISSTNLTTASEYYGKYFSRTIVAGALDPYNNITEFTDNGSANQSELPNGAVDYLLLYGSMEYDHADILQPGASFPSLIDFWLSYPEWVPWEYPLPDPGGLPSVYPIKYPGTEPDPYPVQDPAQNPDPEPAPEIIPEIQPGLDLPEPGAEPAPEPEPDPDPQPEPEPIPDPDPGTPSPDPVNPNPDPTPSPVVPVVPLPATVSSNKLFTVYNPTSAQLDALGAYLWDGSIMASIRDIWQNPLDGLISLIQVYVTPVVSGSHNIILGFLDSGVSSAVVGNQFVTIDCGSVTVPENKKNATDYAPYTSLHLYLPFVGIVELDTNECMKSTINVKYKVDVYTGTCLATVSVTRTEDMPNNPILYTYSGNCSQQIPLTSGNATGMLTALIGGITAGLSVASGGGLGVLAGASIAGQSLTHEMFHVSHSGNLSANAGIMGQKKPYLIIGRRHGYDANDYNSIYGFPANKTVVLGNHTGYIKVKKCFLKTTATQPEHNRIMELLTDGIIL